MVSPNEIMQHSFAVGELAPALYARTDITKYQAAAALMRNFYVDYRGGASTRMGTKYILQAYKSATAVRLIPFQASFTVGYELEFGDFYIRFYYNGAPVLEAAKTITGITQATPAVVAVAAHGYSVGDWVYIASVVGMTQVNTRYFRVKTVPDANHIGLSLVLDDSNVNSTAYTAYASGGTVQRVYTLPSPYAAADNLFLLKYAQSVNSMVICHPSYVPYILTLISAASWTITAITFGPTVSTPTGLSITTTYTTGGPPSTWNLAYIVTAVDLNGQESAPSVAQNLSITQDPRATAGSINISWTAVTGVQSYNVYKAELRGTSLVATGAAFGYVGNCTGITFTDSNIDPDFSITLPVAQNPFQGAGVASYTVTTPGTYTTVPTVTVAAAPSGGSTATAYAILSVTGTPVISSAGAAFSVGDAVIFSNGVVSIVATVDGSGHILTFQPITYPGSSPGSVSSGSIPTNPVTGNKSGGAGSNACSATFTWGVSSVLPILAGAGYTNVPAVTFSAGAAAATAVLGTASAGNPTVPLFTNQRLCLAGPLGAPSQFNLSQPGAPYNYNITFPALPDNAIQANIVSNELNSIKALLSMPAGMTVITDVQAWVINNGSSGSAADAVNITAQAQARDGCNDVRPILAGLDILFVQAKGSIVRNLSYDFYRNVYTGMDVSIWSSHLFYGYQIVDMAWAQEPFKIVWATRNDGTLLSLTFAKEQELIGWAHHDTTGSFKSVSTIVESVSLGNVDAVYMVVERVISGNTVKYIERMTERYFPNGIVDAWCVDAGLQYSGAPATTFTGGEHLAGATCTGLADGVVITPFVMSAAGTFTLTTAASKVTVGLAYSPQLQTLQLDLGDPTVQTKPKKIPAIAVRVQETLGLWIGTHLANIVAMNDLVVGNVGSMTNELVTDLVTGDAQTIVDPDWTPQGQYYITQPNPMPATILGVIPEIVIGDER